MVRVMHKSNVLIVDDSPQWLQILKEIISSEQNFFCLTARNFDEAIELLKNTPIDIAILDRILGIDDTSRNRGGLDIIKWIGNRKMTTKIIITTGYPDLESAIEASKIDNVAHYLSKGSFNFDELITMMKKLI